MKRLRGASGAAKEESSIDDAGSDHADTSKDGGKGKAKRGRNSAASRGGESSVVSVEADEGGDGELGDAGDGTKSSPELELRRESKEAYTIEELVDRLNLLYSKAGLTLDIGFYNTVLDERAKKDETNASAEAPSSAAEGDGVEQADANNRRGGGDAAAAKGSGKRKAPGGSEEALENSAIVANNEGETAAAAAASEEPTQQPTAKRRKEDAASDGGDFSRGGGGSGVGGGDEDFPDFSCGDGGSDSDVGLAPSPPSRTQSSRREGASKPALERARVRASLGKNKVGAAKLRDKIPTGAAGGPGASYLIPKKTAAATPAAATGGGSAGGGAMETIPKKPTLPTISRWARPLGLFVQCSLLLVDRRRPLSYWYLKDLSPRGPPPGCASGRWSCSKRLLWPFSQPHFSSDSKGNVL